jgi:hypothetical protein
LLLLRNHWLLDLLAREVGRASQLEVLVGTNRVALVLLIELGLRLLTGDGPAMERVDLKHLLLTRRSRCGVGLMALL